MDEADRLAEALLVRSALVRQTARRDDPASRIATARTMLESHFLEHHDLDAFCRSHGMSQAAFRRHWLSAVGMPPARYLASLRMREACRLLANTDMRIGAIARLLGFDDPLYFSRRFRSAHGMTARAYRRAHRSGTGR